MKTKWVYFSICTVMWRDDYVVADITEKKGRTINNINKHWRNGRDPHTGGGISGCLLFFEEVHLNFSRNGFNFVFERRICSIEVISLE